MNKLARAVGVLYVKFIAEHRMAAVLPTMLSPCWLDTIENNPLRQQTKPD